MQKIKALINLHSPAGVIRRGTVADFPGPEAEYLIARGFAERVAEPEPEPVKQHQRKQREPKTDGSGD